MLNSRDIIFKPITLFELNDIQIFLNKHNSGIIDLKLILCFITVVYCS